MDTSSMPLLITSAIVVSAKHTALIDPEIRVAEVIKGMHMWLAEPGIKKIVVCDGSGFDLKPYLIEKLPASIDLEVLFFQNNIERVAEQGKGYGEGQIVEFAINNSRILAGSDYFMKCTSKIWVDNFQSCVAGYDGGLYFDFIGWFTPRMIDTRFYIVRKSIYLEVLASAYHKVNDDAGYCLEHAFLDALSGWKISRYAMFPTPRISGISGTLATQYDRGKFRSFLRDLRSYTLKILSR